jgi:hypothetical protein
MANMSYVFGNIRTGTILTEIPLASVTMSRILNDFGTMRSNFKLDSTGYDNLDLINSTVPGQSFVVAERDDVPVWGGLVRTYQSQAKNMQLTCREWGYYAEHRLRLTDFHQVGDGRNIFFELWRELQSTSDSNLNVEVPTNVPSANVKSLTMTGTERKTYAQGMSSLADGNDGFDWTIDTVKNDGAYEKRLRVGYPTLGNADPSLMQFEYPGNILNYYSTDGINNAGTHVYVIGEGEGSSMLVGEYIAQDRMDSGLWLRWDHELARKYLNTQSEVDEHAMTEGVKRKPPLTVIKIEVRGDLEPIFGSYGLGDACTLVIQDPRYPEALQTPTRLVAWDYTPSQSGASEEVSLVFVGDELNGE